MAAKRLQTKPADTSHQGAYHFAPVDELSGYLESCFLLRFNRMSALDKRFIKVLVSPPVSALVFKFLFQCLLALNDLGVRDEVTGKCTKCCRRQEVSRVVESCGESNLC